MNLNPENVWEILDDGGTILGTANSGDPFSWNDKTVPLRSSNASRILGLKD